MVMHDHEARNMMRNACCATHNPRYIMQDARLGGGGGGRQRAIPCAAHDAQLVRGHAPRVMYTVRVR